MLSTFDRKYCLNIFKISSTINSSSQLSPAPAEHLIPLSYLAVCLLHPQVMYLHKFYTFEEKGTSC